MFPCYSYPRLSGFLLHLLFSLVRKLLVYLFLLHLKFPVPLPSSLYGLWWKIWYYLNWFFSPPVFSSVQLLSRVWLCSSVDHSTPGLPVHHQLPEFTETHGHWVGDAIQPSHPLSSPSPPALNLSQHQGLFKSALHIRWPKYWSFSFTSVLPMKTQDWSPLEWTGWISFPKSTTLIGWLGRWYNLKG